MRFPACPLALPGRGRSACVVRGGGRPSVGGAGPASCGTPSSRRPALALWSLSSAGRRRRRAPVVESSLVRFWPPSFLVHRPTVSTRSWSVLGACAPVECPQSVGSPRSCYPPPPPRRARGPCVARAARRVPAVRRVAALVRSHLDHDTRLLYHLLRVDALVVPVWRARARCAPAVRWIIVVCLYALFLTRCPTLRARAPVWCGHASPGRRPPGHRPSRRSAFRPAAFLPTPR